MPSVQGSPAWIEAALLEMERRGVPVGIDGRCLVDRVLAHEKAWAAEAVAHALTALFARSPEERAAVRVAVATFAPKAPKDAGEEPLRPQPLQGPTGGAPRSAGERKTPGPRRPWWLRGFAVVTLIALGIGAALLLREQPPRAPGTQPDAGAATDTTAVTDAAAATAADCAQHDILQLPRVLAFHRPFAQPSPWPGLLLGVASLAAAALLAWRIHEKTRLPSPAPPPLKDGDPIFALTASPLEAPLLTQDERTRLTWGAGRYVSELVGDILDLPASADATVRRGGLPTPRFQRRRLERAIWILEDLDPGELLVAPLAQEVVAELRRAGVPHRHFRFYATPDLLTDEHGQDLTLDDLEDEARHAAIVVLAGGPLLPGRDGRGAPGAEASLRQISRWPRAAVVDLARGRWGLNRLATANKLRCLLPEQLPAWLEDPEEERAEAAPSPGDALARWAALCSQSPLEASWRDALALLDAWQREREGDRRLRALHLPELLRMSQREDRIVLPPRERSRALRRLHRGVPGLAIWAASWWQARLGQEATARATREPRWKESAAGQAYTVTRALVELYAGREPELSIAVLHTHRHGPLQGWIDAQLRRKALRGEAIGEEVEELPCGRETLSPKALGMLAQTPLQRGKPLPRGVRENRWSVAVCAAAAGVGLGALVDGGRRLASEESAAVVVSVRVPVVVCTSKGKTP